MKRGCSKGCPYGLPITIGCKNVGSLIKEMRPISDEKTGEVNYSNVAINWKKMFFQMMKDSKKRFRCPYAEKIGDREVLCSYQDKSIESPSEPKEGEVSIALDAQPVINIFDKQPTNNGTPYYGDASFNDDNYRNTEVSLGLANVGRENSRLT